MGLAFSSAAAAATPTVLALAKAAAPPVASAALAAVARRGSIVPDATTIASSPSATTTTTTVVIEVQVKGLVPAVVAGEVDGTPAASSLTHPTALPETTGPAQTPEAESKNKGVQSTTLPETTAVAPTPEAESKNKGVQSAEEFVVDSLHLFVSDLTGSDGQGNGSLQSPFQTLERALNETRVRGYNTSAKITILDQVQLSAHALDTCVSGKGRQERPPVLATVHNSINVCV